MPSPIQVLQLAQVANLSVLAPRMDGDEADAISVRSHSSNWPSIHLSW